VFPQNAEFYRRVLDEWPSPVLVVDGNSHIVYANRALRDLGGWDIQANVGRSVLEYVHPDSAGPIAEAFFVLAEENQDDAFVKGPWASIHTKLVAENGQVIPVVVTGVGGLGDSEVNGIIYDIRPTHEQDILRRGLTGLAQGEPIDTILELITDMIALPPLELDAAVLEPLGDGSYRVVGATNGTLGSILETACDPQPWNAQVSSPQHIPVSQFPGGIGEDLFAAGYRDFWHVAPESATTHNAYRIVAAERAISHVIAGQADRLSRANELAGVVLLRARADAMLEHSATHDRLTQLPNREGFDRLGTEALAESESETAAMLFIDLDGFKQVNDDHGHAAGDRVLQAVAQRLDLVTRSIDVVARLGGDEFVVLVGDSTDRPANKSRVQVIADRALQELGRAIAVEDTWVTVAASIGAAIVPMPTTLAELQAKADSAMYEAKRANGNRHHIVDYA